MLVKLKGKKLNIYEPFRGFEKQLLEELGAPLAHFGELLIYDTKLKPVLWAKNIWQGAELIQIESISDAARKLRSLGKIWVPYLNSNIRRASLIQEKLRSLPSKRIDFLQPIQEQTLGHWALLDRDHILASAKCSAQLPHGDWEFNEDKNSPPSRAYLKLWEFFTRFRLLPTKENICLELGASPGGWTWVLSKLAKAVISYDRAPLAANIAKQKNISHKIQDAFAVTPETHPEVDWVFSDLICEPERLYGWLKPWLENHKKRNFCLTIKLKGKGNQKWIKKFQSIPKAQVVHLYHNKHELTFFLVQK